MCRAPFLPRFNAFLLQIEDFKKRIAARREQTTRLDAAAEAVRDELEEALALQRILEDRDRISAETQRQLPKDLEAKIKELEHVEGEILSLQAKCQHEVRSCALGWKNR